MAFSEPHALNTISSALLNGESLLAAVGFVLRPRRHAELLLEAALGLDRTELYLNAREPLEPSAIEFYTRLLNRRLAGEPVQHIVGWAPFFGRKFKVGTGVFIPRFDSEVIIEKALERMSERKGALQILDLCCGCGVFGLTMACELEGSQVTLVDNSDTALHFAETNTNALGLAEVARVVCWDALSEPPEEWRGRFDLIVANPPYIPLSDVAALHPDVKNGEPLTALSDGGDGLSFYRSWAETVPMMLQEGGVFFTEIGDGQADEAAAIMKPLFESFTIWNDISGLPRALEAITSSRTINASP
jgi:release factor glutamine methyltransferase